MKSTNTWLRISIALNIFLVCCIGGAAFWFAHGERMIMAGSLRLAGSELGLEERRAFRRNLMEARRAMIAQQQQAREARAQAAELLRQPTVDKAAVVAALDKVRAFEVAVRASVEARAIDFVTGLPLTDREKVADAMERRGKLKAHDED